MQDCFPIDLDNAVFEDIEIIENPQRTRKAIQIIDPEFSCVCPKTGLPDFATIILRYTPDEHIIELKSWKLYLRSYYGVGIFHEEAMQSILDDFTEKVNPIWVDLTLDWHARGGLKTTTQMTWNQKRGATVYPDNWENVNMKRHAGGWRNG